MQKCGAKTKSGKACRHPAGFRTDHVGQGRCWLHGGATPIKSGRYSRIRRPALADSIASYGEDPDPLDVRPELDAARALFQDFVERRHLKSVVKIEVPFRCMDVD